MNHVMQDTNRNQETVTTWCLQSEALPFEIMTFQTKLAEDGWIVEAVFPDYDNKMTVLTVYGWTSDTLKKVLKTFYGIFRAYATGNPQLEEWFHRTTVRGQEYWRHVYRSRD